MKASRRGYHSPLRDEQARQTRDAVIQAATETFETHGWAGTTIALTAQRAEVSPKTIEVIFGTKARLLETAVDYAIRGDSGKRPMPKRPTVAEMEAAPDAATMLSLHAAHLRRVNRRSAALAGVVEHAATADPAVAALWRRMNSNRKYAVHWAATTLIAKPGCRTNLAIADAKTTFWVALDWATYRTLTKYAGLTATGYESWLRTYYARQLLT
jgi:TetR/AcrR family transcriptional regulator, regulator of autoinduction and epiphytic fitness